MAHESGQYLSFTLDDEVFALEIARVREVLEFRGVTRVPQTPEYIRGVINLRGNVVPVVDLRQKFGLGRTVPTVNTCVIMVDVLLDGEATMVGALADSVQEVIGIEPARIEPPPRLGTRLDTRFIRGMGRRDEGFLVILDGDEVLARLFHDEPTALPGRGAVDAAPSPAVELAGAGGGAGA